MSEHDTSDSEPAQDGAPKEVPAWERPESQTPIVEEPDNHKGKLIAVIAVLVTLFFVLPAVGFGIVACNVGTQVHNGLNEFKQQDNGADFNSMLEPAPQTR